MQIEISFAAAYDFNQYTQYVPCPRPSQPRRFWPLPRPAPRCREGGLAMASHPYDDEKMIQRQGRLLLFWKITKASKIMMMKVWINNEDVYYYDDQLDRGEEWLLEAINV